MKKALYMVEELLKNETKEDVVERMAKEIIGNVCKYAVFNENLDMSISDIYKLCKQEIGKQYDTLVTTIPEIRGGFFEDALIIFPRFEYTRDSRYVLKEFCVTSKFEIEENHISLYPVTSFSFEMLLGVYVHNKFIEQAFPIILNSLFRKTWNEKSPLAEITGGENPYPSFIELGNINYRSLLIGISHGLHDYSVLKEMEKEVKIQEDLNWKMVKTLLKEIHKYL